MWGAPSYTLRTGSITAKGLVRFGIKPNDIFATPAIAHRIMSAHVGWDTSDPAKDPCQAPHQLPRTPSGRLADGLEAPFPNPFFCNPPFSHSLTAIAYHLQNKIFMIRTLD